MKAATTTTSGRAEFRVEPSPFVLDYSPKMAPPLTRWERIAEYLKVLYR